MGKYDGFSNARKGEMIGGGYIIMRRGKTSGRVRGAWKPFEHDSEEAAIRQAKKLAKAYPGERFDVFAACHTEQIVDSMPVET